MDKFRAILTKEHQLEILGWRYNAVIGFKLDGDKKLYLEVIGFDDPMELVTSILKYKYVTTVVVSGREFIYTHKSKGILTLLKNLKAEYSPEVNAQKGVQC